MFDAFDNDVYVGCEVWAWPDQAIGNIYIPVKVKIDNILPQDHKGYLVYVAEDTNNEQYRSEEICVVYYSKTKNINVGDVVAYCTLYGSITRGHVVSIDKETKQIKIQMVSEMIGIREGMYVAYKNPEDLVKLADSKKSMIQVVKEYKE
jgi:hypothetical protein